MTTRARRPAQAGTAAYRMPSPAPSRGTARGNPSPVADVSSVSVARTRSPIGLPRGSGNAVAIRREMR